MIVEEKLLRVELGFAGSDLLGRWRVEMDQRELSDPRDDDVLAVNPAELLIGFMRGDVVGHGRCSLAFKIEYRNQAAPSRRRTGARVDSVEAKGAEGRAGSQG